MKKSQEDFIRGGNIIIVLERSLAVVYRPGQRLFKFLILHKKKKKIGDGGKELKNTEMSRQIEISGLVSPGRDFKARWTQTKSACIPPHYVRIVKTHS